MFIVDESVAKDEFQLNTLNECDNTMISIQLDGTVEVGKLTEHLQKKKKMLKVQRI